MRGGSEMLITICFIVAVLQVIASVVFWIIFYSYENFDKVI